MPDTLPYGRQAIDESDVAAVVRALTSDFLTTGPEVEAFERDLARATGAAYAAVVNSGTAALHAAYHALDLGPGDEVVMPPLTFAATANAALYLGARPVFVDVEADTGLLDPTLVEAALTKRTKAIVAVDFTGLPADYHRLRAIAAPRGLALVADAAHSLGAIDRDRGVGTLADLTTLSFHPVKHITSAEGGAVVTESEALRDRVLTFRTHGITRDAARLERDEGPWHQEMQTLGFNYRLNDIQCALGRSQLRKLDKFVARRREIAGRYDDAFGGRTDLQRPGRREGSVSSWHLYILRVTDSARRRRFFERLRDNGLGVQVHYPPVYRHPYYRELGYLDGQCPVAEDYYERAISIPIYPAMTDGDVGRVIDAIDQAAHDILGG